MRRGRPEKRAYPKYAKKRPSSDATVLYTLWRFGIMSRKELEDEIRKKYDFSSTTIWGSIRMLKQKVMISKTENGFTLIGKEVDTRINKALKGQFAPYDRINRKDFALFVGKSPDNEEFIERACFLARAKGKMIVDGPSMYAGATYTPTY